MMTLYKKEPIRLILLFLFLFSTALKTYSQNETFSPIVYPDTVILLPPYVPIVFDGNHLNLTKPSTPECPLTKPLFPPLRIAKYKLFADFYNKNAINRIAYDSVIKNNYQQIRFTVADLVGQAEPIEEIGSNIFHFLFKVDYDMDQNKGNKPERFHPKRRYWIYNGSHTIQLSQNYLSQNWYQGGVKNLNLLNRHNVTFNYKKDKFQINNFAEWKLNLYTNPNDTVRFYRIAEDLIRIYSDFGIQAINNWFYSSNIEIKTQLLNNYAANSRQMVTSLFSPLYINVGILGMRYQIEKVFPKVRGKKLNFNTDISPLSIKYITVLNKSVEPTRFGIDAGKWHITNFGSTVNARVDYFFNKYVNFFSRFNYFTNYEKVMVESENRLNMPINRFFSTTLYLYIRYDDSKNVAKNPSFGYFQINELISFGFNYQW